LKCKKGKANPSEKIHVKKRLITVDSSEENPEDVTYAELSDDDYTTLFESEMADFIENMEESFMFGVVAKGYFFLVKLAGKKKKNIFHYIAEVMNDFNGNEYEVRYYKRIENTNKFILDKETIFLHSQY
jgi:hypothetical protein